MARGLNITAKLLVASTVVVVLGLLIGALALGRQVSTATEDLALREGRAIGASIAGQIQARLERGLSLATSLSGTLSALKAKGVVDRAAYDEVLRRVMVDNPGLAGAWAGYEPNALDGRDADFVDKNSDGTGRYLTYWYDFKDEAGLQPSFLTGYTDSGAVGEYYNRTFAMNAPFATEPTVYDIEGKTVLLTSLAVPIHGAGGKVIGVAGIDLQLEKIWDSIADIKPLGTGSVHVISNGGNWVAFPDASAQGKPIVETYPFLSDVLDTIRAGGTAEVDSDGAFGGADHVHLFLPIPLGTTKNPWSVMVNLPMDQVGAEASALRWSIAIGGLVLVVLLIGALGVVGRNLITKPMAALTAAVEAIDRGETGIRIAGQDRHDEVGAIARALEAFKDNLGRMRALEEENKAALERASAERAAQRTRLADRFEAAVGSVIETVSSKASTMRDTAAAMATRAGNVNAQAMAVSQAAQEASANVSTVATATEELSSSVHEIGQQVHRSSEIAANAVSQAERAKARVAGLAEASDRIGEVVTLITDIASQTNLLALNATIEAARAGEMGKGFAVVANEVKSLANQTARATEDIARQIGEIQTETRESVSAMTAIAETIGRINEISGAIAAAVEEQGAATREIAQSVQQASEGTQRVSGTIAMVSDASAGNRTSAEGMREAASVLATEANGLRAQVQEFLGSIRG
jgi:methyl-accepting chemotaxis protein